MTEFRRPQIALTKALKIPNYYTEAINGEFGEYAFNEERAPLNCGKWREIFQVPETKPVDLEIGTGNGLHFHHLSRTHLDRCVVGIELKYKPLIQSIRRCVRENLKNARICRYHAFNVDQLFAANELNDVYIHFPDPWTSPRKPQNRFVNSMVLDFLYERQRPGSKIEFKTDSREYFLWAMEHVRNSKYKIEFETLNLHQSDLASENFITQFERIFMKQGIEINFVRMRKV